MLTYLIIFHFGIMKIISIREILILNGNIKMNSFHKIITKIWDEVCEISENYKLVNVFINRIEGIN